MNEFQVPPPLAPATQFPPVMPQAPAPWEPKPLESPLQGAFDTLDSKLAQVEKAVASLIERVGPALAPLAPTAPSQQPGAPKPATPPCSDVVRVVNAQSDKLAALVTRVEAATARVEL